MLAISFQDHHGGLRSLEALDEVSRAGIVQRGGASSQYVRDTFVMMAIERTVIRGSK
jgi:hypothetical protein